MTLNMSPSSILKRNRDAVKKWRENHPERVKEYQKKFNSKPDVIQRKLRWAREHRDIINSRRRDQYRIRKNLYMQDLAQTQQQLVAE